MNRLRRLSDGGTALAFAVCAAAALSMLAPSCLVRWDDKEPGTAAADGRCASCHGDPTRSGDFLQRAAPPRDLHGAIDSSYPGVGAHEIHVYGSDTHAAIACSECHLVPATTDAPGHADTEGPAEVELGELAKSGGRSPYYDPVARRCGGSYCHREAPAVWTEPLSSKDACGSCHGLPPPAPHAQSDKCSVCHGDVVNAEGHIIAPALHVDGAVQTNPGKCTKCHGSGDDPAPPLDTLGNEDKSAIGVGAHQAHLNGGASSRPLACSECHDEPDASQTYEHVDGLLAEVRLIGVAAVKDHKAIWDRTSARCSNTYCHGPSPTSTPLSPVWTEPGSLGCTSCHGLPPPAPHPQIADCSRCHADVVANDNKTIMNRNAHIDGIVEVSFDGGCTACHGGATPAPPTDLSGSSSTASPGVGAHQTHLTGTARSRPVPCAECHTVPATALDAGHMDTPPPAEVLFSGAANAFGGAPAYVNGSCQNTSCHGALLPAGHASGGTNTAPVWTEVNSAQAACGACHALPPPAPHPKGDLNPICSACHENIAADNVTFIRPDLHVDGVVTFATP